MSHRGVFALDTGMPGWRKLGMEKARSRTAICKSESKPKKKFRKSMILPEFLDDLCSWQVCKVCKNANIQVCNFASMQVNRYACMQICKYASM